MRGRDQWDAASQWEKTHDEGGRSEAKKYEKKEWKDAPLWIKKIKMLTGKNLKYALLKTRSQLNKSVERAATQSQVFIYISQSHFLWCTQKWGAKWSQRGVMATNTLTDRTDTRTRTTAELWEDEEEQEFEMELWGTMTPSGCYYASE